MEYKKLIEKVLKDNGLKIHEFIGINCNFKFYHIITRKGDKNIQVTGKTYKNCYAHILNYINKKLA